MAVLYGRVTRLQYGCNTGDIFHPCCDRVLRPYSPSVQCPCCGGNCWMNPNGNAKSYKTTTVIDPVSSNPTSRKMRNRYCLVRNWIAIWCRNQSTHHNGQLVTPKNRVTSWPYGLTALWRVDQQSVNSSHTKNSCNGLTVLFNLARKRQKLTAISAD